MWSEGDCEEAENDAYSPEQTDVRNLQAGILLAYVHFQSCHYLFWLNSVVMKRLFFSYQAS